MATFLEALASGPLVVDGAMGSQLFERGVLYNACLEELNLTRPELIRKVHEDYIRAGANVIETNTFGANAMRLDKHGLASKVAVLNEAGVRLAREAAGAKGFVVGAMGPSGYFMVRPRRTTSRRCGARSSSRRARSSAPASTRCSSRRSVRPTSSASQSRAPSRRRAARWRSSRPPPFDQHNRMADGTTSAEVARLMKEWGASVVGVNCCDGPMNVLEAVQPMLETGFPVWAVPNAGLLAVSTIASCTCRRPSTSASTRAACTSSA